MGDKLTIEICNKGFFLTQTRSEDGYNKQIKQWAVNDLDGLHEMLDEALAEIAKDNRERATMLTTKKEKKDGNDSSGTNRKPPELHKGNAGE